jgi:hypothetical protein
MPAAFPSPQPNAPSWMPLPRSLKAVTIGYKEGKRGQIPAKAEEGLANNHNELSETVRTLSHPGTTPNSKKITYLRCRAGIWRRKRLQKGGRKPLKSAEHTSRIGQSVFWVRSSQLIATCGVLYILYKRPHFHLTPWRPTPNNQSLLIVTEC